jgi:autotransporter-associated beta strand protein
MKQLWDWILEHWFAVTMTAATTVASGTVVVGLVLR